MDNFDLKQYLAEGRLLKEVEGSNPVFDEFMKIRNSIDSETIYTTDLVDFIKDLDNTDRENLQRDVERWYIDLVKGKYGDHKNYKDWEMDFIDAFSFEDFADVLHSDQMIFDDFEDYVNDDLTEGKKENPLKVTWDDDVEEVEIVWDGYSYESYTGVYDPEDPNDKILFIHYFDGATPYMPSSFEYLEQYGGETFIDDEEATLTISVEDLKKTTPSLNENEELSSKEQEIFDDIVGSLNEGKFEDVVSKVKEYTRKGLMTAAILSALMSPQLGFSKSQHQELQNIAKTELPSEISPMSNLKKGEKVKYKMGSTDVMSIELDGDVFKIELKDSGDSSMNQKIIDSLLDLGGYPNKEINWEEDNSISVPITNAKDLSNTLNNIFKLYKNG